MSFAFARLVCPRLFLPNAVRDASLNGVLPRLFSTTSFPRQDSQPSAVWDDIVDRATDEIHQDLQKSMSEKLIVTPEQRWASQSKQVRANSLLTYDPYKGRSVPVIDGNLAHALNNLDGILRRNKVRKQLKLAERHEKKGVKRRRLESERWRRLFAHQVRKSVQLVTKIRDRGA